jgi:hypothetical protein
MIEFDVPPTFPGRFIRTIWSSRCDRARGFCFRQRMRQSELEWLALSEFVEAVAQTVTASLEPF